MVKTKKQTTSSRKPKKGPAKRVRDDDDAVSEGSAFSFESPPDTPPSAKKPKKPTPKKRKSLKVAKADDAEEWHAETVPGMRIGAHVSMAGGFHNAVTEACSIKATAFALFLKSARSWAGKPLTDDDCKKFEKACKEHGFHPKHIVPHGSYLVNLGSPDSDVLSKSRECFVDELQRAERLGLCMLNIHPGSSRGEMSTKACIEQIAREINAAMKKVKTVQVVLENTAGGGSTIGRNFEELRDIINLIHDKSRVGVCLDTCHLFASGYDVRSKADWEKVLKEFDEVIGMHRLRAFHLNDSKTKKGSGVDRHACLGKGEIGKECFRVLMNHPKLSHVPMVLETPPNEVGLAKELAWLRSLVE